jgi:hypothetical protein
MVKPDESLRVTFASGGFFPQTFRWEGRFYRILAVHSIRTCGLERRYRVATSAGDFELALAVSSGGWHIRHAPNWLSRAWYRLHSGPRYPLPAWRRRRARVNSDRQAGMQPHADPALQILVQPVAAR